MNTNKHEWGSGRITKGWGAGNGRTGLTGGTGWTFDAGRSCGTPQSIAHRVGQALVDCKLVVKPSNSDRIQVNPTKKLWIEDENEEEKEGRRAMTRRRYWRTGPRSAPDWQDGQPPPAFRRSGAEKRSQNEAKMRPRTGGCAGKAIRESPVFRGKRGVSSGLGAPVHAPGKITERSHRDGGMTK
jgi:hypothetical protein